MLLRFTERLHNYTKSIGMDFFSCTMSQNFCWMRWQTYKTFVFAVLSQADKNICCINISMYFIHVTINKARRKFNLFHLLGANAIFFLRKQRSFLTSLKFLNAIWCVIKKNYKCVQIHLSHGTPAPQVSSWNIIKYVKFHFFTITSFREAYCTKLFNF